MKTILHPPRPTPAPRPPRLPTTRTLLCLGLATALALGGCSTPSSVTPSGTVPPAGRTADQQRRSDFDKSLDAWHGATVQELVRKLGKPESIDLRNDGALDYQYSKSGRTTGDKRPAFSCTVRYIVEGGTLRVIGHTIQGC
ncbi:hypothetical protein QRD43_02985 [Pelomonas sp. APW6]|uniref:Outer membrane protein assembly factor BamE n=1 Tax=Roseateles subflavus TaxID=3053353 RepID=A0ABT7LDC2_9BURK|nr:hypothetical protein [Pelomonas sp. APW6]MDL5030860.1 hypothetical protein [Pelomonas sp. APW6]